MENTPPNRLQILELMNGYRAACVVGAAAELDLWSILDDLAGETSGSRPVPVFSSAEQVATWLSADLRAMVMLLDGLAALQLLDKRGDRYAVPPELRDWLTRDGRQTLLPMLQHSMNCLRSWQQLAWVVQSGAPRPRQASIRGAEADRAAFIAAMHSISGPVADDLVARLGPPQFRHLLDVGGASGTWTLAFLRAVPDSTATIFDLPDAIEQAHERLRASDFANRVTLVAGDFYADALPAGADYAWVSAIAHQHSRQHNRALYAKVFAALQPGGRIAIRDIVMEPCRTQPVDGALFAINMLANTESGGTFTFAEFAEDLQASGFVEPVLRIKDPWMNSVVEAKKPPA